MLCREVMKTKVYSCSEKDTAKDCARIMRENKVGFVPVTDDERHFLGVVTDRDLALRILADGKRKSTKLRDIMTREQVTCAPADDLSVAERRMAEAKKSRIVVVDERNHVVGVISLSDIGRAEKPEQAGRIFSSIVEREAQPPAAM